MGLAGPPWFGRLTASRAAGEHWELTSPCTLEWVGCLSIFFVGATWAAVGRFASDVLIGRGEATEFEISEIDNPRRGRGIRDAVEFDISVNFLKILFFKFKFLSESFVETWFFEKTWAGFVANCF